MKDNEVLYSAVPVLEQSDHALQANTYSQIKISLSQSNGKTITGTENGKITKESKSQEYPLLPFHKLYQYSDTFERFLLFVGILSAIVSGLCEPATVYIYGDFIGAIVAAVISADTTELTNAVSSFAIGNASIGGIVLIFTYMSILLFNYTGQRQIYRIRNMYLESALHQDISWYDLTRSGETASRLAEDIGKLEYGISEKAVMFVQSIVAFLGCSALAFASGWKLALVCMIILPVSIGVVGSASIITTRLGRKEVEAYGKAGSIAEEVLSAIRTVIAFGGQKLELKRYAENLAYAYTNNVKKSFFSGLGFGFLWFSIYSSYALSFWYGINLIVEDRKLPATEQAYDTSTLVKVFFATMMGFVNLGMISPFIEAFGIARAAGSEVFAVINRKSAINSLSKDGNKPIKFNGSIQFKNVSFNYPSRPEVKVLQNLNLTINQGESVALVGESGCGKSTCIQLLQRFYDPENGQLLLDGYDLKDLNIAWFRSNIGVVGQEPVLFGTTIGENIRYGKIDATDEEIVTAAKEANAHDFIMKLQNGYDTMVGEQGAQMSGGQKQRIAIARALVRSPKILLLDEATSALDTRSEARVQAALDKASQGRTTIIVAHRLSTIRGADKIFVLSKGVVVEQGNHEELMALKKHYFALVTKQISELEEPKHRGLNQEAIIENQQDDEDGEEIIMNTKLYEKEELEEPKPVSMMSVLKYSKPEQSYILAGAIMSVIIGFSNPIFGILFGDLLGILSEPDSARVSSRTNKDCLYFTFLGIIIGSATFVQSFVFGVAGERLTKRLRELAFGTILKQELAWFDLSSNGTGLLCAKLSGEAAAVQGATGQRIGILIQSVTTILSSLVLAMYYEWRLGLIGAAFMPVILIAMYLQGLLIVQETVSYHKTLEQSTKIAVEAVINIRTVVGLGTEETFQSAYADAMRPCFKIAKRNTHGRAIVFALARSILCFAYAASMRYGGGLIINEGLDYTIVFKVVQTLITGSVMVANVSAFAPNYQKGLISAGKMFMLFNRQPKIVDPANPQEDEWSNKGDINYESVKFEYPTRPGITVLQGLNLEIPTGKTLALIGSSGCGKSTTIHLLERFYDPNAGSIIIGNRAVSSVTLASLRSNLGIVSQEPTLFARTIADNIAYGDNTRKVSMADIVSAAKKANIHEFITSLPLGYDTKLGDKGTQLSGGQKQRVAIARALISNPKVLLLDEATSALDTENEQIVQAALDEAKEGRTCITIAHRLSTIQDANKICVLDRGIIAESGTHAELIAKKGLYYKLCTLQA